MMTKSLRVMAAAAAVAVLGTVAGGVAPRALLAQDRDRVLRDLYNNPEQFDRLSQAARRMIRARFERRTASGKARGAGQSDGPFRWRQIGR